MAKFSSSIDVLFAYLQRHSDPPDQSQLIGIFTLHHQAEQASGFTGNVAILVWWNRCSHRHQLWKKQRRSTHCRQRFDITYYLQQIWLPPYGRFIFAMVAQQDGADSGIIHVIARGHSWVSIFSTSGTDHFVKMLIMFSLKRTALYSFNIQLDRSDFYERSNSGFDIYAKCTSSLVIPA